LDRQTAADTIRNGSLLSLSQPTEATGNNSDASPQVETSRDVPRKKVKRTPEEDILRREANALQTKSYQEKDDKTRGDLCERKRVQLASTVMYYAALVR
jgi:hypothetical protein